MMHEIIHDISISSNMHFFLNKIYIPFFNTVFYFILPRPFPRFLPDSLLLFVDAVALLLLAAVGFFV